MFNIRVYGILINQHEEVLITDEFRLGRYMTKFPGGGLQFGEGTIDCLKREINEEIGQEAMNVVHFYTTDFFQKVELLKTGEQLMSIYYFFTIPDPDSVLVSKKVFDIPKEEGAQSFRWIKLTDLLPDALTFPVDKKVAGLLQKKFGI